MQRGTRGWQASLHVAALCAALTVAAPLSAQRITGTVSDRSTGQPVAFAIVALVAESGDVRRQTLTTAEGAFLIASTDTGTFRLRAERIGYATTTTPPIRLAAGSTERVNLAIEPTAVSLEAISVTGVRTCAIRASAADVLRVWTEARKALQTAQLAEREQLLLYSGVVRTARVTDGGVMVEQSLDPFRNRATTPFRSLAPADLMAGGYVRRDGDGWIYHAPNAEVLLSSEFEDANCFTLVRSRTAPDLLGIEFSPSEIMRGVPAVTGTVWLDAVTSHLKSVDFRYTNVAPIPYADAAHGTVEFRVLPNGAWTISRWAIRVPSSVEERTTGSRREVRVALYAERGGEVRSVATSGQFWSLVESGAVSGIAWDSIAGRPLAGARVSLGGAHLAARSDERGHFRIADVPAGRYTVELTHARLDSLPHSPTWPAITVQAGAVAQVTLAVPRLQSSVENVCARRGLATGSALFGMVRDAATGAPLADLPLRGLWNQLRADDDWVATSRLEAETQSDGTGRYILCGLPAVTDVTLMALLPDSMVWQTVKQTGRSPGAAPLLVDRAAVADADVALREYDEAALYADLIAACPEALPNHVRLAARVFDRDSDVPLPAAVVAVSWSGSGPEPLSVTSDAAGRVVFCAVPAQTPLDVRVAAFGRIAASGLELPATATAVVDVPVTIGGGGSRLHIDARTPLPDAPPHGEVSGRITWDDGAPVSHAALRVQALTSASDAGGRFTLSPLPPGEHVLEIDHIAAGTQRENVRVGPGERVSVDIRLTQRAIALPALEAHAAGTAAARRVSSGRLDVVTGADLAIAEARGTTLAALLRWFPGVRVMEGSFATRYGRAIGFCVTTTTRLGSFGGPRDWCESVPVIVDGATVGDPVAFLRVAQLHDYESVELLRAAEAQARFGMEAGAAGGAILLWTRGRGPYASDARNR